MINTTLIAIALFVNPVANMDGEIVSSNLQRGGGHVKVDKKTNSRFNLNRGGGHIKVDKKNEK